MRVFAVDDADSIEAHVTVAHDQVEAGREQLIKAAAYQACITFLSADIATQHYKVMDYVRTTVTC